MIHSFFWYTQTLREKCPNTKLFLVLIFLYSVWIRRDTEYLSKFSPNTKKYGPEITPHSNNFYALKVFDKDNRLRLMATLENILIKYQLQMMYLLISDVILTVGNGSNTKYDIDRAIGNCQEDCLSTFLFIYFTFILKMLP